MYDELTCNNFQINTSLKIFYIMYIWYFRNSACQIKYGSPKSRAGEFVLMNNYNTFSNIMFLIYRGLPFMFEIRTLLDWTFTATSLTLFQWFKFEEIYAVLYNSKCDQLEFAAHPRGQKLGKCDKLLKGCCFLLGIMLCILAPLIIFSSLNPIFYSNPVKNIEMAVGVKTSQNNFYELSTITMIASRKRVSDTVWRDKKFDQISLFTTSDRDNMDALTLNYYPDTDWLASSSTRTSLCSLLNSKTQSLYLQVQYSFFRDYPSSQQNIEARQSITLSEENASKLCNVTLSMGNSLSLPKAFSEVIKLVSTGTSLQPQIIEQSQFSQNITLTFTGTAWQVTSVAGKGLTLYVSSETYSPVTFNFSVITFYISVVYLIGRVLRIIVAGGANNIPLTDMPNADPLINLCGGIYLSRMKGDLLMEEVLYYELIDILRSPEIIKMVTGSSSIKRKEE